MPLYTIDIFANNKAQETATRQAIAGVLSKSPHELKVDATKLYLGTVRLVADLSDTQRQNIIRMSGVQAVLLVQ